MHRFATSHSALIKGLLKYFYRPFLSLSYWDLDVLKNNVDSGVFILVYML